MQNDIKKIASSVYTAFFLLALCECRDPVEPIEAIECQLWPGAYYGIPGRDVTFNVICPTSVPVSEAEFFVNGVAISGNRFTPDASGSYSVYARGPNFQTSQIEISIREVRELSSIEIPLLFQIVNSGLNFNAEEVCKDLNDFFTYSKNKRPEIVDTQIRFRPAQFDLQGVEFPEKGVVRHSVNSSDSAFERSIMKLYPPEKYLNIIVKQPSGGLGVAFPAPGNVLYPDCSRSIAKNLFGMIEVDDSVSTFEEYDRVIKNAPISNPSSHLASFIGAYVILAEESFEIAFVASHEIGHMFGLLHPSDGGCPAENECLEDSKCYWDNGQLRYCSNDYPIYSHPSIMQGGIGFTYDECELMRHSLDYRPMIRELKYSNR
jgi:hypothetical protein